VPFLGRGQQIDALAVYLEQRFPEAKADLATAILERMLALAAPSGTVASVTPQNWLQIGTYRDLRERLLRSSTFNIFASLGMKSFAVMATWDFNIALVAISMTRPNPRTTLLGIDLASHQDASAKAAACIAKNVSLNPSKRRNYEIRRRGSCLSRSATGRFVDSRREFRGFSKR